jgi:hypothetical protein
VTYGTASSPYLATRCLQQLAEGESKGFSLSPETLTNNFYVNGSLCGANAIEDALILQQELIALLGRRGFHLRKFCASHPNTLEAVPPDCREMEVLIELDSNEGILIYIQQNATLRRLFHVESALHVLGGIITHHQEHK